MSAIWTTPKTWQLNDVYDATKMNEQMRDNEDYLFTRPLDFARVSYPSETDLYPVASGWQPLTAFDLSIATESGRLEYSLNMHLNVAAARVINFDVFFVEANVWLSSGTAVQTTNGAAEGASTVATIDITIPIHGFVELAAGTYTCRLYIRASAINVYSQDLLTYFPSVKEV